MGTPLTEAQMAKAALVELFGVSIPASSRTSENHD